MLTTRENNYDSYRWSYWPIRQSRHTVVVDVGQSVRDMTHTLDKPTALKRLGIEVVRGDLHNTDTCSTNYKSGTV